MSTRPRGLAKEIRGLLLSGMSSADVRRKLGVGKSTVSFHAQKLGLGGRRHKRDWSDVQKLLDEGHTARKVMELSGVKSTPFYLAVKRGKITVPTREHAHSWLGPEELSQRLMGKSGRGPRYRMKKRLLECGVLEYECKICGISEWRGARIDLRLDHIDGDGTNFAIDNLRLLCPNCDSQQDTYCHKHPKSKSSMREWWNSKTQPP